MDIACISILHDFDAVINFFFFAPSLCPSFSSFFFLNPRIRVVQWFWICMSFGYTRWWIFFFFSAEKTSKRLNEECACVVAYEREYFSEKSGKLFFMRWAERAAQKRMWNWFRDGKTTKRRNWVTQIRDNFSMARNSTKCFDPIFFQKKKHVSALLRARHTWEILWFRAW